MKREVIGWIDYENYAVEDGVIDDAAVEAVIEDIRSHGYMFTGYHHQEHYNCVPVLDDGLARRFSRRSFAAVMARAHGYTEPMDYVRFMEDFSIREKALRFPTFARTYFPPSAEEEEDDSEDDYSFLQSLRSESEDENGTEDDGNASQQGEE